jgi:hypothetical protein
MIAEPAPEKLSAHNATLRRSQHSTQAKRTVMKKFTRQTSGNAPTADVNLDFAAAGAKVARLFEPGEYRLRIDSARIIQNNQNVSVLLNLI